MIAWYLVDIMLKRKIVFRQCWTVRCILIILRRAFPLTINRFGWGHRLLQTTPDVRFCKWDPTISGEIRGRKPLKSTEIGNDVEKNVDNSGEWRGAWVWPQKPLILSQYLQRNLGINDINTQSHRDAGLFMINNTPPAAEEKPMGRAEEEATVISRNRGGYRHAIRLAICWISAAFDSNRAEHDRIYTVYLYHLDCITIQEDLGRLFYCKRDFACWYIVSIFAFCNPIFV